LREGLFVAGLGCPEARCQIVQSKMVDGNLVSTSEASDAYVAVWREKVDPSYESPYGKSGRRDLQAGSSAALIQKSIICLKPYDSMAFEVNEDHYPVYIKDSPYNSDENFDYGYFRTLENKLTSA